MNIRNILRMGVACLLVAFLILPSCTITKSRKILVIYSTSMRTQIGTGFTKETAQTGNVFLVVDMNIQNHGYCSFSVNSSYFSALVENVRYNPVFASALDNPVQPVTLVDNGTTKGELAFEIPLHEYDIDLQWYGPNKYNIQWDQPMFPF